MRVSLYAGTSPHERNPVSCRAQLEKLRELAGARQWIVTAEYVDERKTAGARREFQKLMRAAETHKFDAVLFWSLERFCPEGTPRMLRTLQTLTSFGVQYQSATEPFLDSTGPCRDAVIGTIAMVAAHEHNRRSERIRAGLERSRGKKRSRPGGRPRVSVDMEQLLQLRLEDRSLAEIARELGISKSSVARLVREQQQKEHEEAGGQKQAPAWSASMEVKR